MPDPNGPRLGEILRQTVRNQIRGNEPPEVAVTYRRLIAEGHDDPSAIELIATVLSVEIYAILKGHRSFDEAKFTAHLRRLPELPYEDDA